MTPPAVAQQGYGTTPAELRAAMRAAEIGRFYNGRAHFAWTSLGSLAVIAWALAQLRAVRPVEWLALPLSFLLANFVEYWAHRIPMHRPVAGMGILYRRHSLSHHRFYSAGAMTAESARDLKLVLFPPVMLLFFLGCIATPVALALRVLTSANVAWLNVAVSLGYFLCYEWLHTAYHLAPGSWVGRLPGMAHLRRHHTRHHDPALMGRWNFNITFPICDALLGTCYRGAPPWEAPE